MMRRLPVLILMAALAAGPALAQPAATTTGPTMAGPAATPLPQDFYAPTDLYGYLAMAGACDQFAVQSARLAMVRSHDESVLAFARSSRTAHEAWAAHRLAESNRAGLHPPLPALTGDFQRRLDALARSSDADFGAAYLTEMMRILDQTVAVQAAYAERGDNAILRDVARESIALVGARRAEAQARLAGPPNGA